MDISKDSARLEHKSTTRVNAAAAGVASAKT